MPVRLKVTTHGAGMLPHVSLYRDPRSKITTCLSSCSSFDPCEIFTSLPARTSLFTGRSGKTLSSSLRNTVSANKPSTTRHINSSVSASRRSPRRLSKSERGRTKPNIVVCAVARIPLRFGSSSFASFASASYKAKAHACGCDLQPAVICCVASAADSMSTTPLPTSMIPSFNLTLGSMMMSPTLNSTTSASRRKCLRISRDLMPTRCVKSKSGIAARMRPGDVRDGGSGCIISL
mmetsp:Transcript_3429/g.13284  ORF Transcript_3429/g.13284 Transcript_3429/m.13284 type:complete len:235 (+) Transcript_3429:1226-1930(+)